MAFPANAWSGCPSGGSVYGGIYRLPAWVPAPNTVATITEANTFQSVNPGRSGANGWSFNSSGVSIGGDSYIFAGMIDAFSGGVFNPWLGSKGSMVYCGGGHSVSNWGGVVVWDIATKTYWIAIGGSQNCYPIDAANGEYADGSPTSTHTYDALAIVGPESGYPLGALVLTAITGGTSEATAATRCAHLFDFANPGDGWIRYTENAVWLSIASGPCSAYDPDLNRTWWMCPGNKLANVPYIDHATETTTGLTITNRIPPSESDSLSMRYDRERHLLIHMNTPSDQSVRRVYYMDTTNAANGFLQATLSTAFPLPSAGLGFSFDKVPDGSYLCNSQGRIFRMVVPAVLTNTWEVTEITYSGTALNQAYVHGKRWSYVPGLESFVWKAESGDAHQIYRV